VIERVRRWRRVRTERRSFSTRAAPHRPLVRELIVAHLPVLQRQARRRAIDQLVDRIIDLERSPVPLIEEPRPQQLALLIARAQQAIERAETDAHHIAQRFANLAGMVSQMQTERDRRRVLAQYIRDTVQDRRAQREDLRALERDLDYDALRERQARDRHRTIVCAEIGIHFIGRAATASITATEHRVHPRELVNGVGTFGFLVARMDNGPRWIDRLAAADALLPLARAARAARALPDDLAPAIETAADLCAGGDEHAWVQARALELLVVLDPAAGEARLRERLRPPAAGQDRPPLDFLTRAELVALASRALSADEAVALLAEIAPGDPSEHVRMAACEVLPPIDAAIDLIDELTSPDEASARVRACALIAAARIVARGERTAIVQRASDAITHALAIEQDELPLQVGCEELATAATAMLAGDAGRLADELAPQWITALGAVAARDDVSCAITEIANAAAETIERERSPARRAAEHTLRDIAWSIRPGSTRRLDLRSLPDDVAALLGDPHTLGRALANVTRDDWGMSAELRGDRITLWRGDRFRRRLWRILHELRSPAPNKRQGYVHTTGRHPRGDIRAPAGLLDEATATTVPGEHIQVEGDRGWGRHVPTVDDLLSLPLWRSRPIHVYSSHGVTTVRPAPRLARRALTRLSITLRYRSLAMLRQSSLMSDDDRDRGRFVAEVRESLGIDISFTPYAHAGEVARPDTDTQLHPKVAQLFPPPAPPLALGAAVPAGLEHARDWIGQNTDYFSSLTANGQAALALFVGAGIAIHIGGAYRQRRALERWRASIPLSIGGWGTRGKSGTERIKAGLLQGLGLEVFSKTTGCEAMVIHSVGGQRSEEIFIYRPYDKATIWEQANMLHLASRLGTELCLGEV